MCIWVPVREGGSLGLFRASQAVAAIQGRDYVTPDDIKKIAEPILSHRLILAPGAHLQDLNEDSILKEILNNVPVPRNYNKPA